MGKVYTWLSAAVIAAIVSSIFAGTVLAGPTEQQLATGSLSVEQSLPSLSNSTLVWVDNRSGNQDIFMMDLATGSVSPVTLNGADQNNPSINGSKVVWTDSRDLIGPNIYVKDLMTGAEQRVNIATYLTPDYPAVSGNRVFWQARDWTPPTFSHSRYRDLSQASEGLIDGKVMDQLYPVASGNRVAWTDVFLTLRHVEVKDLPSGEPQFVASTDWEHFNPAMDGDNIVWEDERDRNSDIYLKSLSTGTEQAVATGPSYQHHPAIAGKLVAWLEDNKVMLKNMDSGASLQLSTDIASTKGTPKVGSGWVVWQDGRNGNADLYGVNLAPGKPQLRLFYQRSYWSSYQAYAARRLSVEYRLENPQGSVPAYKMQVTAAQANKGVTLASSLPLAAGDLGRNAEKNFVLDFQVPAGVTRFTTWLHFSSLDGAANLYRYPN